MAQLSPSPKQVFFGADGNPLAAGKLYTYAAGTNTPLATYSDSTGTLNTNPIILDARGEATIYLTSASYKFVLKTSADATIYTQDNIESTESLEVALAASSGASLVGYLPSGTGAVATTVQNKLRESVSVKDFGAVGDGIADDSAAIIFAAALGTKVHFPAGEYLCTSFSITPAAGTTFYGDGKGTSTIRFKSTTTTSKIDFDTVNGNITFENLTLYHDGVVSETAQIIAVRGNNLTVSGCEIKSNDSAIVDTITNAFQFLDSDVVNFNVNNCDIHNVNRVILKANTATAVVNGVSFTNNYIHDLGMGGVQFNFPLGSISGVRVIGNQFKDFYSGTEQIFCGGASLQDAVIANNVFKGSCNECVHIEEAGKNVVIANNVFSADGDGVYILDNNVSGSYAQPERVVITGNVFDNKGTPGTNSGVHAAEDSLGLESYSYLTISNNTFNAYEYGIRTGLGEGVIRNNFVTNCTTGIRTNSAHPDIENNYFDTCTTGIDVLTFAGMVGNNTFRNCTTLAKTNATDSSRVSMTGFKVIVEDGTVLTASTTTDVPLGISVGAEHYGQAKISAYIGTSSFRNRISTLSYDGTALTDTELMMHGSGTVAASGFQNSAGTLAFRFNNTGGSNVTLRYMVAEFDGMWVSTT